MYIASRVNFQSNLVMKRSVLLLTIISLFGCNEEKYSPLSPSEELESFQLADPNLEITLIASEPDIISPVDMCWGPDGSLYVVEMTGYPVTKNKGKIKKLTDDDGDGVYNLKSTFADNLDFPVSVMYYKNGLLIADAPHIYLMHDTDGDGVADKKEIFLTGFEPANEQYRANSLQWGLDNWIYGANGRASGEIRFGETDESTSITGRDFRFNPETNEIEAISGLSQFGLAIDNWGNRFTTLNHRFARQVLLEQQYLERNPALVNQSIFDTSLGEHDRRVWTLLTSTLRFNQDPIGYFTSLSGLTAYRGNLLGPAYDGSFFAGESVQAAVIRRKLEKEGPVFRARNIEEEKEFLQSTDEWFHPVNFSNGPDGALYMVDFYRKFVEHPEWADDDKEDGIDWNEGESHGRIWRIARKDKPLNVDRMKPALGGNDVQQLVSQFEDSAAWRRDMAQQLIIEDQIAQASPLLEEMLSNSKPLSRNHTLWTLEGLGLLKSDHILKALNDENSNVIIQGIKLAERHVTIPVEILEKLQSLARSQNGDLRFHAILALGATQKFDVASTLVSTLKSYPDQWTKIAALSAASQAPLDFANELFTQEILQSDCRENLDFFRQIGNLIAYNAGPKNTNWINRFINEETARSCARWSMLAGYLDILDQIGSEIPPLESEFFQYALENIELEPSEFLAPLAIEVLRFTPSSEQIEQLIDVILGTENVELQVAGIRMLSHLEDTEYMDQFFLELDILGEKAKSELISNSINSVSSSLSVLKALDQKLVGSTEVTEEVRYALMNHDNSQVRKKAKELLESTVDPDRQKLIDQYLVAIDDKPEDPELGAGIFSANCTSCHSINGKGGEIGPDLTNIGTRSDEVLLTSILDPSRMVSYELELHVITTTGGKVYSGMVTSETTTSITIKQSDGREHTILLENIKEDNWTNQSIMPEGYERIIDEKQMASLLAYLRNPGIN